MTIYRKVCQSCGSDDLLRDGSLRWDVKTQEWVVSSEDYLIICSDCDDEMGEDDADELEVVEYSHNPWVRLYGGTAPEHGDAVLLSFFFEQNEGGIGADEQEAIRKSLIETGTYHGGGGAGWRIWAIPAPKTEGAP